MRSRKRSAVTDGHDPWCGRLCQRAGPGSPFLTAFGQRAVETGRLSQSLESCRGRQFRKRGHADWKRRELGGHQRGRKHPGDRCTSRERRRQGNQRQPERPLRLQRRRRVRVQAHGHHVGAAGLHQGIDSRRGRQFRIDGSLEQRRQHPGRCGVLRSQRGHRHQRQAERSIDSPGRGRVCLCARRYHLVTAGLCQGVEHRESRRRLVQRRRPFGYSMS